MWLGVPFCRLRFCRTLLQLLRLERGLTQTQLSATERVDLHEKRIMPGTRSTCNVMPAAMGQPEVGGGAG